MIFRTDHTDAIKPLYGVYLKYMSQFFKIHNYDSWHQSALKYLHKYSIDANRHIFVQKKSETILGFAMVNQHFRFNTDGFAIAEFHIQKDHERKGLGRKLAKHVFTQFPGNWEIAVAKKNNPAHRFWKEVIADFTNSRFRKKQTPSFNGTIFLFNNE